MLAVFFLQYVELVRSKFRGAVMRVFRDRRADSDRSLRLGWTIFVWLMTRQLVSDVDLVEQAELDRLEGLPPCLPGHGLSFGTCDVSVDHVFGEENTSRKVWHTYQHTYTPSRGPSLDNQRSAQVQPRPCKLTAVPSTAYYGKHGYKCPRRGGANLQGSSLKRTTRTFLCTACSLHCTSHV